MTNCEIISVGTEILLGNILNTDAQFLSEQLALMGINVLYQTTVGDNRRRLLEALNVASSRSDIIILSGGLGPTPDDLTKEVCCEFFSVDTYLDENSLAKIENYFKNKGMPMASSNKKQALLPVGSTVFHNSCGTAPGAAMEKDGKHILILPGPPGELKPMFFEYAVPYLSRFSDGVIVSHNIRTFGIGESQMAEKAGELLSLQNPTVAPYAKSGEALLRVTAKADSANQAEELMRPVIDEIKARLNKYIYGIDTSSIEEALVRILKEKHLKIATAESCTGGYIAKRITDIPGSSEVFECGIVSYANNIKESVLGVKHDTLEKFGAVSEAVAKQMAQGALSVSGADIAISITGISGPESDGSGQPVGLSYIGLAAKDGTWVIKYLTGKRKNSREYNRYVSGSNAINLAIKYLMGLI